MRIDATHAMEDKREAPEERLSDTEKDPDAEPLVSALPECEALEDELEYQDYLELAASNAGVALSQFRKLKKPPKEASENATT